MSDTKTTGLNGDQVRRFLDDGFFIVRELLPRAAIQPLIDELKQKVDEAVHAAVEQGVLDPAHTFKLRTWPSLLDVVESIIGPEILAHPQFNIRTKLPDQVETVLPWHQDLAFVNSEEAGDTLLVNCWIPLVDARAGNGCMQMMRGTHGLPLLPHDLRVPLPGGKHCVGIDDRDLPDCEVVTGELNAGDVLLTTERVLHRSLPNVSETVRWSVDTRYTALGLPTGRADVPGFVARSSNHPDRVARSAQDWNERVEAGLWQERRDLLATGN